MKLVMKINSNRGSAGLGSEVKDQVRALLREKEGRMTAARMQIVDAVVSMRGIFSARDLIAALHRGGPQEASIPTVYRLLRVLVQIGILRTTVDPNHPLRYELAFMESSQHRAVCTQCGSVTLFESGVFDRLLSQIAQDGGFSPSPAGQRILCRCARCRDPSAGIDSLLDHGRMRRRIWRGR